MSQSVIFCFHYCRLKMNISTNRYAFKQNCELLLNICKVLIFRYLLDVISFTTMRRINTTLLFILLFSGFSAMQNLYAQNNLRVAWRDAASAPQNLNICTEEITVTLRVSTDGSNSATRRNMRASLSLFKGIEFVRFNSSGSTAGVATGTTSATRVNFTLPDVTPSSPVDISYVIRANCLYADTLALNDLLSVNDTWQFTYDISSSTNVTETDLSTEYRDAIKVPYFTMFVSNNAPLVARPNNVYQRTIIVNNSGLQGYVKDFLYRNTAGPGMVIKAMRVNGTSITFTKSPTFNSNGDTLITATVDSTFFTGNTRGSSGPLADGDRLFEPDETVTIVEDFELKSCSRSLASAHVVSWGCDARYCTTLTRNDIVRLGTGQASVGTTTAVPYVLRDTIGGYCKAGRKTVVIYNNGVEVDAGSANMYDVEAGVGFDMNMVLTSTGFRITSMHIAGKEITLTIPNMFSIKDNPLFATDPDGVGVGLDDLDGDGFYDDLALGKTLEVSVAYDVDCGISLSNRNDNCTNDFEAGFNLQVRYINSCGESQSYSNPVFFTPSNSNSFIENCPDPDAWTNGTPFVIEHHERRFVSNFSKSCGGTEYFLVKVKLPTGVTPIRDSFTFKRFTTAMNINSFSVVGDTLYIQYDASSLFSLNGDYYLKLGFTADCSAVPGETEFPTEITFVCPPCGCSHLWFCDSLAGPRMHYAEPPCPPNAAYGCAQGLKTTLFEAERTTLGYTDATYRTHIAKEDANLKVAMTCDSVQMRILNTVGTTPISDSIGVRISYNNVTDVPETNMNDIFKFGRATVHIVRGGVRTVCTIDSTAATYVRTDSTKAIYVNLSSCLGGVPVTSGDSVNFYGDFMVAPNGPYNTTFEKLPNFRAYGYHTEGGAEYACDNYGQTFRLGKSGVLFAYPNSSNYPSGCNEANLDYRILILNNGYVDYFGNEYRQAAKVDSILLHFDPAFLSAFSTRVQVAMPDHPYAGSTFYDLHPLDSTGYYVARFDTLNIVPSFQSAWDYAFDLRIKATPNCGSLVGSSSNNAIFDFNPTIYYQDRYYASVIGDGSCTLHQRDSVNSEIVYSGQAALTFTPTTSLTVTTTADTVSWQVKVCNSSTTGNAGMTWVAVKPTATVTDFEVLSIKDVTNSLDIRNLTLHRYDTDSSAYFAYANGLTIGSPFANLDSICNVLEITAQIGTCGLSEYEFSTGWDCQTPTDSTWNPDKHPPCSVLTLDAQVEMEAPFLDAEYINQSLTTLPGICDTNTLEILLRNTDLGNAYNIRSRFVIPLTGATLLPNSFEVAYPSGAAYAPAIGTPTLIGQNQRGKIYQFSDMSLLNTFLHNNGLQGFNALTPNDSNEVKIRFKYTTDCDFRSGSLSYFSFLGRSACNTNTNNESGETLPLMIDGADLSTTKEYSVGVESTNEFVAGGETDIQVNFTNKKATLSDSSDVITVRLPEGITYRPNTSVGAYPSTWIPGEPIIRMLGTVQSLAWRQPLNMALNDSAAIRFKVVTNDTFACTGSQLELVVCTAAYIELSCQTTGTPCLVEVITTSNGEQFFATPLSTDSISISGIGVSGNYISVRDGDSVRIVAHNALNYTWTRLSDGVVLTTDSVLTYTPTRDTTTIRVSASGNCIAPANIFINRIPNDTTPPRITLRADSLTVGCRDTFRLVFPTVSDDFAPVNSITLTYADTITPLVPCGEQLTRTWRATDTSGNTAIAREIQFRRDTTAPTITPLGVLVGRNSGDTLTYSCGNEPVFAASNVGVNDDCATLTAVLTSIANITGNCPVDGFILLRGYQWTATDACGRSANFIIYVKSIDTTAPILRGVPTDSTMYIGDTIPPAPTVTATDACDATPRVSMTETIHTDSLVIRTWTATDTCGNRSSATQRIRLIPRDSVAPIIRFTKDLFVISCRDTFPLLFPTIIDNMDSTNQVTVTYRDSISGTYPCAQTLRRTWTAIDRVGNRATAVQTIFKQDTSAPVITPRSASLLGRNSGDTLTVTCTNIPTFALTDVDISDDCDTLPLTTGISNTDTAGTCATNGYIRLKAYNWTATDHCGNSALFRIYVKIIDTVAPTVTPRHTALLALRSGDTLTVNCDSIPQFTVADMTYNDCDTTGMRTSFVDNPQTFGNCARDGYAVIMDCDWTATDQCGNTTTFKIFIKVVDTTAPVITPRHAQLLGRRSGDTLTVNCGGSGSVPTFVVGDMTFDDCDTNRLTKSMTSNRVAGTCAVNGYTALTTYTWTATDQCDNRTTFRIYVKEVDTSAPTITPRNALLIGKRSGDTLTVNCSFIPEFFVTDMTYNDCDTTGMRTSFVDNPRTFGTCSRDGYVAIMDCDWTATDRCGNTSAFKLYIKVVDTTAPVLTPNHPLIAGFQSGDTLTVTCDNMPILRVNDMTHTDCDTAQLRKEFVDIAVNYGNCEVDGFLVLMECEWRTTDQCNNVGRFKIFVKVVDTVAPILVNVPIDTIMILGSPMPPRPTNVIARDLCDDMPTLDFRESRISDSLFTRTWIGIDQCGNQVTQTQRLEFRSRQRVPDSIAPVIVPNVRILSGLNSGDTLTVYNCQDAVMDINSVDVSDLIDLSPNIQLDSTIIQNTGGCRQNGFICFKRYTWSAIDMSNNRNSYSIFFRLADTSAPTFVNVPRNITLACNEPMPTPSVSVTDNCSAPTMDVQIRRMLAVNGDSTITYTYTAEDECGNAAQPIQWTVTRTACRQGSTTCSNFGSDTINLTSIDCTRPTQWCLPFSATDLRRFVITQDGAPYMGTATTCDTNRQWAAISIDTGRHTFVFRDTVNACADTIIVNTTCSTLPIVERTDTIQIGNTSNKCFSDLNLRGNVTYINNVCAQSSNIHADFVTNTSCINITGRSIGTDTACFIICTDSQDCVLYRLRTIVVPVPIVTTPDTFDIVLEVGESDSLCLDLSELSGNEFDIRNICRDSLTAAATFTLDSTTCVKITANQAGNTMICYELCDTLGTCDRTVLYVTVIAQRQTTRPVAVLDTTSTIRNKAVTIPIMLNDTIQEALQNIRIVIEPSHGTVKLVPDAQRYIAEYTPNEGYCGSEFDAFMYEICTNSGCSSAEVQVKVLCDGLVIYSAFSPNEDMQNDFFHIDGLEEYPETELRIFNRWGMQVYHSSDYKNDWQGTWNGAPVPDGSYFYRIVLKNGKTFSGFVQVQR